MKNLYKILLVSAGLVCATSCSKDYLTNIPTGSVSTNTIFETVDNMKYAVNGMYKCMVQQYSSYGQGYNGEGTIKWYLGDYPGNNFNRYDSQNIYLCDGSYHTNPKSTWAGYPWYYYYRLIGNANNIICLGPDAKGDAAEREYLIGQAKVIRAFAYMQLSQRFHYRWGMNKHSEVKNGNGLVLRITNDAEPMGLSSADDTFKQIYQDLDDALVALNNGSLSRDPLNENYQIDADVAHAVYARAALVREDYATALQHAKAARAKHPLMSNEEYRSGFCTPNKEWIWSSFSDETETLYYYSFHAYMAYNANTSASRKDPRSIAKQMFEKMDPSDVRRSLFLDPENMSYSDHNGKAGDALEAKARKMYPALPSSATVCAFQAFKFYATAQPGVGHLNHFRSSEMILIEAECNYKLGNEEAAQAALEELNAERIEDYTCETTGEDLFNEIKFFRGIELWGEGFEWFDLKRWNDPIDRKGFDEGGNSYYKYVVKNEQSEINNWWTSVIPEKETNYNPLIK